MPKHSDGTPCKKSSTAQGRLARTPLEQRSGNKPIAPSPQGRPAARKERREPGTGAKPVPMRRRQGWTAWEAVSGGERQRCGALGKSRGRQSDGRLLLLPERYLAILTLLHERSVVILRI